MKRNAIQDIEARNAKIVKLYNEGVEQPALAERFGVTQSYVSHLVCKEKENVRTG